jgi:CO/xanthine dehydrogenase FAD-binding subunit
VAAWRSIGFAARAEAVGRADPKRYQTALHHLDENLGAIELELTKGDVSQIAKGAIRYGALTTHAAFEDGRVPDASNGLMPYIGSQIAYRAVRTRGTIGGAVALADPAADWLTTIIALEGEVALVGPNGRRTVAGTDFALGPYMTVIDDAELIEAIIVPRRPRSERWGRYNVARKTGEYAESMAIALIDKALGKARLVVGAIDGAPLVLDKGAKAKHAIRRRRKSLPSKFLQQRVQALHPSSGSFLN